MAEARRCRCSSVGGVGRGSSDLVHGGNGGAVRGNGGETTGAREARRGL